MAPLLVLLLGLGQRCLSLISHRLLLICRRLSLVSHRLSLVLHCLSSIAHCLAPPVREGLVPAGTQNYFNKYDVPQCMVCKNRRAFLLQSCVKFYTDSGEKVWEGCGKMGKGLEVAKSYDSVQQRAPFSASPSLANAVAAFHRLSTAVCRRVTPS